MYKVVKYYLLNLWRILRTSVCRLEIYKVGIARRRKCKSAVCILISITSTSIGVQWLFHRGAGTSVCIHGQTDVNSS